MIFLLLCTFIILMAAGRAWAAHRRGIRERRRIRSERLTSGRITFGFFHPYCNAGGGGERVLWAGVRACLAAYPSAHCVVYTGDVDATGDQILARAKERFAIELSPERVRFVFLKRRWLVEDTTYPRFTLLGQSLGSVALAAEVVPYGVAPDVFIDTMGYAFTYPLIKLLLGCPVVSYTHYPTISTDMLTKIGQSESSFNNASFISRSRVLSSAKLIYYRLFASLYGHCGRYADVVMVNSSWTRDHIESIFGRPDRTFLVYPPCDTSALETLPETGRRPWIVSVAQFRPEKNHALQIDAFAHALTRFPALAGMRDVRLVLVGGCRGDADAKRVDALRLLAAERGVADKVEFAVNAPHADLLGYLRAGSVALHTMADEHFGIGVVEGMAAGMIVVAHDSAGPKRDIVVPLEGDGQTTGFLARTRDEYADAMYRALTMPAGERERMVAAARKSVHRFSEAAFAQQWVQCVGAATGAY
ncbi:asparagine-linked glycosylation protein [Blastocladiella emersonii ATCC 22665]|nr:asparagine-linked glycosylation protein [Blastocladiella emersonii ATCC 22665]